MEGRFTGEVRTNDFTMGYVRFGHGKRTLVILPGLSVDKVTSYADAVVASYGLLTDDFTIYVIDRRDEVPAGYSIGQMAHDTVEAMEALGLGGVALFGASQGGMIALAIAAEHPELVESLILGSTSSRIDEARYQEVFDPWARLARDRDTLNLYLRFGEGVYPAAVFEQAKDALVAGARGVTEGQLDRFVILTEALRGFDVSDSLAAITCPTLVIGSFDDRVLGGEASFDVAYALTGSARRELRMYDGYGHAAYDTHPHYREVMLRFLTSE